MTETTEERFAENWIGAYRCPVGAVELKIERDRLEELDKQVARVTGRGLNSKRKKPCNHKRVGEMQRQRQKDRAKTRSKKNATTPRYN